MSSSLKSILLGSAVILVMSGAPFSQETFDLDALIAAAQSEPPITVYAVTGKIVDTAQAFTETYGIQAEGRKVNEADQVELLIRESQAGNIVGDVSVAADVAAVAAQLLPNAIVESWVPEDLAGKIAPEWSDPLVLVNDPHVFAYNTEVFDTCPVSNIWELTEPEHARKLAMLDPLIKPNYADWFNQMETHYDAEMAAAYEAHFGIPLETEERSATAAWVRAYAENQPLLGDSTSVAEAIGAPGQTEPFFGLTSVAKFRDNKTGGFKLGLCTGMEPFIGWLYPGPGLIAAGTDSPNAARLFIHYLLTAEGIAPQTIDGKISTNSDIPIPSDEPSGIADHLDDVMAFSMATAQADFDARQDWQDFWRIHYSR
ncbi:iron(III) transport system substrate-binding protein [Pelagibacterium luteolum]|uniref:Iron(III) transport system substrate-binding protein n=2 Tax=Pelagibacterium luteolum TaxID=440168 RepID=A0A1G7XXK0_9HYPH|nr:iron(III) transport system substrate-binding protein [Pelagibacterium luteolum]